MTTGPTGRLLALLSLLQVRRDWPGTVLADRLGVSARTVRRDVDRLRELGYPVHADKGPDGGYRLDAGAHLPPLLFDDQQAVAVALALHSAPVTGAGVDEAAARALATLVQVMRARLRTRLDTLRAVVADPAAPVDPDVLVAIGTAIRRHETLRFDRAGDDTPRAVQPHHLLARRGRWYLVAWSPDRDDWRVYRVDRLRPRHPNGPRFAPREVPGGDPAGFVAARFRGASAPGAGWPCEGVAVVGRSAAQVAPFVPDATVERVSARRCRVTLGSWSWTGLAAGLLRFDADVEVVGPPELREAFAALAERSAAAALSRPT